jgi:hypothetical protein
MATVHYGGTEYSYPGAPGFDEAIRRFADEHGGDVAALGDGAVTWSVAFDFAPIVKACTLTMPDGTVYEGIAAIDVVDGSVTFTPAGKGERKADQPPPP